MEEYYMALYGCLEKFGYQPCRHKELLYFKKEQETGCLLLRLIKEPLAGQRAVDLKGEHRRLCEAARDLMIMGGQRTETLMLYVADYHPKMEMVEEIEEFEDVWFLSRSEKKLYIYENQRADFYGLARRLESFMEEWDHSKKVERKLTLRENVTPVATLICIINVLVFLFMTILGDSENAEFMARHGAMVYDSVVSMKEYYRLFTAMFLHFGIEHLGQNMLMLLLIGGVLERNVGKIRFIIIYLAAGLISSLASLFFTLRLAPYVVSAGASGAICGIMGGILFLIVENMLSQGRKSIEGITLRGMIVIILMGVGYGFMVSGVDNAAHIGGLIGGFCVTAMLEGVQAIWRVMSSAR